ncbi:MAG: UvrB/UvrC motif-containing protein [Planctomycetota bacterium]|nr:UvrB/UvrC motif-containing protein [Planctomycetota bacterium]
MHDSRDISQLLSDWEFEVGKIGVRLVSLGETDVIQMRVEMGILQMQTTGRPDGHRPAGMDTYLDALIAEKVAHGSDWELDAEHCIEVDREFMQFYQRRISWLQLKQYPNVIRDADHTLALMDFCKTHAPVEGWGVTHEQYRPFVLFHRTQADALDALDTATAEVAIQRINSGLRKIQAVFTEHEIEEHFEDDELVQQLRETRESLREEYDVGLTLNEQLEKAIADEQYERAAELRDQIESA